MFLLESSRIAEQSKEVEEKFRIADAQLTESNADHEKIKEEYEKLGNDMAELDERINVLRETINNSSMTKSKLESQIQILTEQIHAAEMTDEHLQGRLDAIEKDKQERLEANKQYYSEKRKAGCTISGTSGMPDSKTAGAGNYPTGNPAVQRDNRAWTEGTVPVTE